MEEPGELNKSSIRCQPKCPSTSSLAAYYSNSTDIAKVIGIKHFLEVPTLRLIKADSIKNYVE